MIITCPACSAQYLLPDDAIGPKGRRVKCTTCDYTWLQAPETEDEKTQDAVTDSEETPEIVYRDQEKPAEQSDISDDDDDFSINIQDFINEANRALRRNTKRVAIDGVMYALCALIVTGVLLVSFSKKIVTLWPEAALLYETLQIPVAPPAQGIEFQDIKIVTTATATQAGDVAVTGQLVNKSQHFVRLPPLKVRAFASDGGWLKDWTIHLGGAVLSAGKEATLDYMLQDAPAGTAKITLIFID